MCKGSMPSRCACPFNKWLRMRMILCESPDNRREIIRSRCFFAWWFCVPGAWKYQLPHVYVVRFNGSSPLKQHRQKGTVEVQAIRHRYYLKGPQSPCVGRTLASLLPFRTHKFISIFFFSVSIHPEALSFLFSQADNTSQHGCLRNEVVSEGRYVQGGEFWKDPMLSPRCWCWLARLLPTPSTEKRHVEGSL